MGRTRRVAWLPLAAMGIAGCLAGGTASAQAPAAVNWKEQQTEILRHYRDLVQIDTRSGNETKAVDYLKRVFESEGVPVEVFALQPARANLVARIRGNGRKKPLLLLFSIGCQSQYDLGNVDFL